jgi:pimeloyl-ACP methyl ester carboxylesterase
VVLAVVSAVSAGPLTRAQALTPPAIASSDLRVRLDRVGQMPTKKNPTSPAVAGSVLLLVDQGGSIYRWDGGTAQEILRAGSAPSGVTPVGSEAVLNVAADRAGTGVFVAFTSSTVPPGVLKRPSSRPGADAWQVICRYDFDGSVLSSPKPIVALQVRTDGHTGGGMVVLDDGSVLFGTADNGDAGEDGRTWAQDDASHLSKLLRIDPTSGAPRVVARGVRNPQRLALYKHGGEAFIDFIDLGGSVAEELDSLPVSALSGQPILNLGWGRNPADGRAREGTFYIDAGGAAIGSAPTPETGFLQPVAQFGREGASSFVGSGPVSSTTSFSRITSLFGDLVSGSVYAITGALPAAHRDVVHVQLVDNHQQTVHLKDLAGGGARPDPRFFNFPDGAAGVLLEASGEFYRLTELPASASSSQRVDSTFDSNGVTIHYMTEGQGPPVVLVHELDGSLETWVSAGVAGDLARDHQVIALDCRGHGRSGKPHEIERYGSEMALDLSRLLDHLGIKQAHFVGYSLGAEIVTMLMVRQPERMLSATLVAGAGRFRWLSEDLQHAQEEALEFLNFGVSPTLFLERSPDGTPEPSVETLAKDVDLKDPQRDRQALFALSNARHDRLVSEPGVASTPVRTLGVVGSADPELASLQALQHLRPSVKIVTIDGATHVGPKAVIRRPEFLAALRAFIDGK